MELKKILKLQEELDSIILDNLYSKGKTISTNELLTDRILALFTEVAEFANEVGSFKYWKHYHVEDPRKILEELMDILFFWLSIANLLEYDSTQLEEAYMKKWRENVSRQQNRY